MSKIDKMRAKQQQPTKVLPPVDHERISAILGSNIKPMPANIAAIVAASPLPAPIGITDGFPSEDHISIIRGRGPQPKKTRKNRSAISERDRRMEQNGRLPHGSSFSFWYNATEERWTGVLCISTPAKVPGELKESFADSASGVFKLLTKLDNQYRSWLAEQEAGK